MLYVYGVVDVPYFAVLAGEGFEAADVVAASCGTLAAAVSVLSAGAIAATPPNVRHHEKVLERLMAAHTVLPMRFGSVCADADALQAMLMRSQDGLRSDLERVCGKVEIALRIADEGGPEEAQNEAGTGGGRGTAYLRSRQQCYCSERTREDAAARLGLLLRQHLAPALDDIDCVPAPSSGYRVSCLVARERVSQFTAALSGFAHDHPNYTASVTGPWPPYSFVSAMRGLQ
jgi:hypothetical protein